MEDLIDKFKCAVMETFKVLDGVQIVDEKLFYLLLSCSPVVKYEEGTDNDKNSR